MKRQIIFAMYFLLFGNFMFAQNYYGANVVVNVIDDTTSEKNILKTLVSQKVSSNLYDYLHFNLLNEENAPEIKKIIRNAEESGVYDESTIAKVLEELHAEYMISVKVIKVDSKYALICDFTELSSAKVKSVTVTGKNTPDELYATPGCAADEITIKLCDLIGISLTNTQINVLKYGESELSDDELRKKLEEDALEWEKRLQNIDARIVELNASTDLSAIEEKNRLEANRIRAEQMLRTTQIRKQQQEEAERKRKEDIENDKKRSSEIKKARDNQAFQAEKKALEFRKEKLETSSLTTQINIIEAKKKVFVEIREDIEFDVIESNLFLTQEMQKEISNIENREYSKAELVNGEPTPKAVKNRQDEITEKESEYKDMIASAAERIRKSVQLEQDELLKEIRSDYNTIAQTRTITSLGNDVKCSIGEYNGESCSWNVTLYIYSDGMPLAEQSFDLKYKDLTGKAPVLKYDKNNKNYEIEKNDYDDTVELYDSWFQRGDPVLIFEIDCNAVAKSDEYFSQYDFNFLEIRVRDTVKGTILYSVVPSQKLQEYKMSIEYDIRSLEAQRIAKEKYDEVVEKERLLKEKELQKAEKERVRQELKEERKKERQERWEEIALENEDTRDNYLDRNWHIGVVGIVNLGTNGINFGGGARYGGKHFFIFGNAGRGFADVGIGYKIFIPILKYPPSILLEGGLNPIFIDSGVGVLSVGVEVPLNFMFSIYAEGNYCKTSGFYMNIGIYWGS